ncbi:MAG: riboflavin synthase [Gammaproteobacteria bacterium]|nr:riboflavin synthase [Gammaproteobacteria bacterium]
MFTGIVQAVGRLVAVEDRGGDVRLEVDVTGLPEARLAPGASVAVNGVCLTVTGRQGSAAAFDVSRETLARTTLGRCVAGARLNLEPALTLADPLGGHLVTGHVDGVGEVVAIEPDVRSTRVTFRLPPALVRYVARKGSLCVDGVSLTVNEVSGDQAGVNLVPHTLAHTIMGDYNIGTAVNLEVDLIARYLERLLGEQGRIPGQPPD